MTPRVQALYEQALALDPGERADLVSRLAESLEVEEDPELAETLRRRMAEIDTGAVELVPWDQVRQGLRQRLADSRP